MRANVWSRNGMHQSAIVLVRCVPGSSLLPPPYWKARRPWGRGWVILLTPRLPSLLINRAKRPCPLESGHFFSPDSCGQCQEPIMTVPKLNHTWERFFGQRMDGWKADLCKNKNGVSKIRNKIKNIKGKKKKMEHRNKNWRWNGKPTTLKKGKINRQQQQQKIQNTNTQNAEYIRCAIMLQPIFKAYFFKGSANFQRLYESPVL